MTRRFLRFLLTLCIAGTVLPAPAEAQTSPAEAWLIPIRGDIDPAMTAFVRRETRKALAENAGVIIFEIDTFGGRVDSALQITSFIMSIKTAKTAAWVHNGEESMGVSWSAGALIAFACREIYMAAGTSMGAAAPITLDPDGSAQSVGEKTVAAVRSQIAALAERNGHPVGIALAMVDYDVELWEVSTDGVTKALTDEEITALEKTAPVERIKEIAPKGKLLSLTAGEAYRYGLAKGIADDADTLLADLGVTGDLIESAPEVTDDVISFLTSSPVQSILILLGLVMLFLELHSPGFGVLGAIGLICFAVVFGSGILLGKVGSLELILFLLGIGLLALELFVIPGFGVVGITGIIAIGLSLILSMQDFVIPQFGWEWDILGENIISVSLGILGAGVGIAVIALLGPRIRLFDRFTLKTRITGTAGGPASEIQYADGADCVNGLSSSSGLYSPKGVYYTGGSDSAGETDYAGLPGKEGIAATTLRPSGNAEIEGRRYSVETEGTFVESGTAVKVVQVIGSRIIVKRI